MKQANPSLCSKKRVAQAVPLSHYPAMNQDPYHYALIARAIDHIGDTVQEHPKLDDVAAAVGLSPMHFQRVFSQWAGVSPKRFQQYLTLSHAKTLLNDRFTVLETTHETGLSSSSRLHDLFLKWEAMSPGEYAAKGTDLAINYGFFSSPFGEMLVMGTKRGICGLAFTAETGRKNALSDLKSRWPNAIFSKAPDSLDVAALLDSDKAAKLHLIGAPFQIKVWEALLHVPSGQVTTYSEIAQSIGRPKAVRAVGTAVGRNPISWLIPCHRALRKSGGLGGYHWGLPVKRALLAWESARFDAQEPSV